MNNKGFMMAELVVVTSVVVVILTTLYISFNKVMSSYDEIMNYNDIGTMYRLGYYYKSLEAANKIGKVDKTALLIDNSSDVNDETINGVVYKDIVYITNVSKLNELKKEEKVRQGFDDYISYVLEDITDDTKQILIMESCQIKNNNITCKYAYMNADVEVVEVE